MYRPKNYLEGWITLFLIAAISVAVYAIGKHVKGKYNVDARSHYRTQPVAGR